MADLRDEITEALLKHGVAADVCCGSAILPLVEAHVAAKVAEAKAEAMREAADVWLPADRTSHRPMEYEQVRDWLHYRADAIGGGTS
jgi:hypothetical protein